MGNTYIEILDSLVSSLPFTDTMDKQLYGSASIRELIFTPEDKTQRVPIYDDVPYAGMLGVDFSLFARTEDSLEEYRLSIGVFGPDAGAQSLQDIVHEINGDEKAQGWDNQLDNHFYAEIGYMLGMKHVDHSFSNGTRFQWFNSVYADAGNAYVGAGAGTVVRYGHNMPDNFKLASTLISGSNDEHIGFSSRPKGWGWSVSAGVAANAINYFYLYEESEKLGYDFDRPSLLIHDSIGVDLYLGNFQVSLELHPTSAAMRKDESLSSSWGRMNLIWHVE